MDDTPSPTGFSLLMSMSVYRSISMKVTVGEVTSIGNYFLGGNVFNAQLQNSSDKYKYVSLQEKG